MNDQEFTGTEKEKVIELAGCIIADSNGRILLLHRKNPDKIQWELPGGKFDPEKDSNLQDTARREISEELGVEAKLIGEIGFSEFSENGNLFEYTWYWTKIIAGLPDLTEPEKFDQLQYFSWEEIGEMGDALSPNMKNLFKAYENKSLKLEKPQPR